MFLLKKECIALTQHQTYVCISSEAREITTDLNFKIKKIKILKKNRCSF